ncbi:dipeptidyl aminopeptidase/acylaminoacyl peptidase [Gelidibacter sediminis]|uniref:Dipeptidyl aminopeptidase/acylaminoacyl peptidase n=1 Tax=Gelidibacter sediminis TaxID=1608710 RepID=A0A4R7Q7Y0_9FLAO|nr:DPP IV N-terminal domain-containing protein [Gelidibacter sediminis]TDU43092.1 dipeptidyl aminopeptidase/acylaminoacyl peptidase [Gelidibacter sediminis]
MKKFFYLVMLLMVTSQIQAQKLTQDDYNRAVSFMPDNINNKTVFNLHTDVQWFKNNSGAWFVHHNKAGKTYQSVVFSNYKIRPLFDHSKVAHALSKVTEKEVDANQMELSNIERTKADQLTFNFESKTYTLDLKSYKIQLEKEDKKEAKDAFQTTSPDGKWIAFSRDYNLFIKSTATNQEYQLSQDGVKDYEYATYYGWYDVIEGENAERPKHFNVNWSKDSKWIAANVVDFRTAEKMYLLDHSIDSLYRPKLLSYYRGSPGDTTMVHVKPVFFNIETKKEVKTKLPKGTHINSVAVEWLEKSGQLLAGYSERGYQKEFLKLVDLNTNKEEVLIEETSETNIDNFWFRALEDKRKIIFLSERSGWRQLYMVDIKTKVTTPLTAGNYYINSVAHIDDDKEEIYFLASGKDATMNPYHQQLYKVDFMGTVKLLTPENAHHLVSFSEDGKHFVDNYSTVNSPTKTVLRTARTGKIVANLTSAEVSDALSKGWEAPQPFQLIGKDGKTTIYGAIWKPTNFDATKSYPIIDHSYTGPHTQVFPKSFNNAFTNQSLAELGFIVMMVDGLGSSGRSKEFHNHSYKNMGNNLEDHVLAIQYLGKTYSWIDTNRVGIFGHSAGGYDTGRAMLAFPDVYKVGVASSADHDFRMEKAWWPEMYQGWPVDSTYHDVSNITNAKNLKGKLLLVHGGIDENVNPSATFKLAEALVNADKDFDLLIFPSQRHGYQGKVRNYFTKKRWNYFVEHLKGEKPIWDFNWN